MKNLLIIQITNNEIKTLFCPLHIKDNYITNKYSSISEFITNNRPKLTQVNQVVVVGYEIDVTIKELISSKLEAVIYDKYENVEIKFIDYATSLISYCIAFTSNIDYSNYQVLFQENDELLTYVVNEYGNETKKNITAKLLKTGIDFKKLAPKLRDEKLCDITPKYIKDSTEVIYLTSDVFNGGYLNTALQILCIDRRVFLENDLFILGGYAYIYNKIVDNPLVDYTINTPHTWGNRLSLISYKNDDEKKEIILIDESVNYFDRVEDIYILNKSQNYIVLKLNDSLFKLPIGIFKKKLRKPNILKLSITISKDIIKIYVSDNGFGQFIKANNSQLVYYIRGKYLKDNSLTPCKSNISILKYISNFSYYSSMFDKEIYTMEELCYLIFENIHLINEEFIDDDLALFVKRYIGQDIKKLGFYQAIMNIMVNSCLYDRNDINHISDVLSNYAKGDFITKSKIIADKCLLKEEYNLAIKHYDSILSKNNVTTLDKNLIHSIKFNKAIALTRILYFKDAYLIFKELYDDDPSDTNELYYFLSMYFYDKNLYEKNYDLIPKSVKDNIFIIVKRLNEKHINETMNLLEVNELLDEWKGHIVDRI